MFTFENRKTVDSTVCTVLLRARRCLRNAFYAQPFLIDTFLTLLNCFFSLISRFDVHCDAVEECKKRWRSLRDAFMKQHKLLSRGDPNTKKKWLFYDAMLFLAPYFDV